MRALVLSHAPEGKFTLEEVAAPMPKPDEVLIKVAYAGLNRADLFQLQKRYPLPERSPAVPGFEVSGEVAAAGGSVTRFKAGDKVCALMSEGGFADYVVVPESHTLPVPNAMSLAEAAALPEAAFTAWVSFVWQAKLRAGETVLVHGGASGVGSLALQIARERGAKVFATAGTIEKCAAIAALGAQAINYQDEDFVEVVMKATGGRGADIVLDMVGGDYIARNFAVLAMGGRLCQIAFLKGAKQELNCSPILLKHLSVMGSTLRARSDAEKARIASELQESLWPALAEQRIKPLIARIFPFSDVKKAIGYMEQRLNVGKILLKI